MKREILAAAAAAVILHAQESAIDSTAFNPDSDELAAYSDSGEAGPDSVEVYPETSTLDSTELDPEEDELFPTDCSRWTTSYAAFGGSYFDFDKMNSRLGSFGFPRIENAAVQAGIGRKVQNSRLVREYALTGHWWRESRNAAKQSDMAAADFSFQLGADLVKSNDFGLIPYVGLDAGAVRLSLSQKDILFSDVASGEPADDLVMTKTSIGGQAGVGMDFHKMREGVSVLAGFRIGYRFDFSDPTRWNHQSSSVKEGPSLSLSGPFAKFVLGLTRPRK